MVPDRYGFDLKRIIFKLIIENSCLDTHCEITLRWITQNLTNASLGQYKLWNPIAQGDGILWHQQQAIAWTNNWFPCPSSESSTYPDSSCTDCQHQTHDKLWEINIAWYWFLWLVPGVCSQVNMSYQTSLKPLALIQGTGVMLGETPGAPNACINGMARWIYPKELWGYNGACHPGGHS